MQDNQPESKPPVKIKAPVGSSRVPDKYSAKGPTFIPDGAPHQVFRFCRWGIEYGTDDKGHAASIILSVTLLALLCLLFVIGGFVERVWITDGIKIIGTAFTFTAGVAIGKGSSSSKPSSVE